VAIQKVPTEVNAFVKGLITEASPLTFPENASLDEQNFILNRDGSRQRRLGMDLQGSSRILPSIGLGEKATSAYQWKDVGGIANLSFIVCQVGTTLLFYSEDPDFNVPQFHSELDMSSVVPFATENIPQVDMASIDGVLVVAEGDGNILAVTYQENIDTFVPSTFRLKIRDLFGIQVAYQRNERTRYLEDGSTKFYPFRQIDDMLDDDALQVRPFRDDSPNLHFYNLRNQSWGRVRESVRLPSKAEGVLDPIQEFDDTTLFLPSNADAVPTGLINYSEELGAPVRFVAKELGLSPQSSSSAARGFFIIDALQRGFSRKQQYDLMFEEAAGDLTVDLTAPLIADNTIGGAKCVAEFAGRAWYGGFSGDTFYPDSRSPRLSSFVMFSQLVKGSSDLNKCYQKNDPTYEKEADLLATDGGFIKLDGAFGIQRLVSLGNSLIVFATNGIWAISGGTDEGFTAESYIVKKITDQGIIAPQSLVVINDNCMFWGEEGIYLLAPADLGGYSAKNITNTTIQKKYESIPVEQRKSAYGIHDKYENTARWVYGIKAVGNTSSELILNLDLQAFSVNVMQPVSVTSPVILAPITVPPFKTGTAPSDVYVGIDPVLSGTDEVFINEKSSVSAQRETYYFTLTSEDRLAVGFAAYTDENFLDWKTSDGIGIDAEAYLITGYGPQGDFQRRKQVTKLTSYMLKTEDGFEMDGEDIVPSNPSSCIVQARWDWHNSPNGNRWGRENQIYKNKRLYIPDDVSDGYDDGELVITTKTKLRGHGKTLSLLFKTEPEKACKLLGWSMVTDVSTNV
tara:strand:- start:9378 stop:11765 length:2388 start_codon:yes stop_codon:yes gene_type:complete